MSEYENACGLTSDEVAERVARGETNAVREKNGKSYLGIVFSKLFTFFNMVWAIIAIVMAALGSFKNMTFLMVIIPNVLIAIIGECRAKHTVEKLSVTTDPKVTVIRDGVAVCIAGDETVTDGVMVVEMGQQILADATVLSGVAEANESMLTGESNAIRKTDGDTLLAGSFLVSGKVYAKVIRVGKNNYVHTIEHAAKKFKPPLSDLCRDLNKLLRYIAIFMVPMSVAMYFSNFNATGEIATALKKTCGSLIGMIPAGMYLLITVTLTLSVISLAEKKTLVQDMYSIEMLARADVICLDKTGTITDGTMTLTDLLPLSGKKPAELGKILARLEGTTESINPTAKAVIEAYGVDKSVAATDVVPFSSSRKYSAATFPDIGTFAFGAPHFVPGEVSEKTAAAIAAFAEEGKRVLMLSEVTADGALPLALVAIADRIRPNAAETIKKFQDNGVAVKVISGDHPATVSSIAKRVGILNADKYISCEDLTDEQLSDLAEDYAVFGRVTPEQKVLLVKRLRALGHTVAMTGDGVNDTLALKESNCAIAMADGSEMARKVSQIVLLNSDFSTLPDVVREGRRCVNNVRTSSTLYLMKTILTILLSLYTVITANLYPFEPYHTVPLEVFVIGFASVLLALEPNNKRIEGAFIKSVLLASLPSAIALFAPILTLIGIFPAGGDVEIRNTLCMISLTVTGFVNLAFLCIPYTKWRAAVVALMGAATVGAIPLSVHLLGDMFSLKPIFGNVWVWPVILASMAFAAALQLFHRYLTPRILRLFRKKTA